MTYQEIQTFVFREARLLDDRQWDDWLMCYHPKCEYWMPAWDDDDQLTNDPHKEISLIYYPNRNGLEDRVYRIKPERSGASMPEPRTTHQCSNLEVLNQDETTAEIRYNFNTLSHRYRETTNFFGTVFCSLDISGETPVITRKKVILNNDYINQVIDVYHL